MTKAIEAVVVNHNSSIFTELMLRSLFATHKPEPGISITIMDNNSTDNMDILKNYADGKEISIIRSGYSIDSSINTHGEILRQFVLTRPNCKYYLFLDTDICFYQDNTINTMLEEIECKKNAYAVLAKLISGRNEKASYQYLRRKVVWDINCSFTVFTADGYQKNFNNGPNKQFIGRGAEVSRELPPHCTLIKNTPLFRRVAKYASFSDVCTFEEGIGSVYDILGLVAMIMKINRKVIIPSVCSVRHFGRITYADQKELERKSRICREMLMKLRV
jgi:hypothetical protein